MALPVKPSAKIALPDITSTTSPMLAALTEALGVDRGVLASDEEIEDAWGNLPKYLGRIPTELRNESIARMCVAVAAGLFDSAINYIWNTSVIELRDKVRNFGLTVVPQIINRDFDEAHLIELKDAELLDLCLKLNLISEDGFFMLSQCRELRNNFSAAHPSMGSVDEATLIYFLNQCAKHALANEKNPKGVDIQKFLKSLKAAKFSVDQLKAWNERIEDTFDAQRELLIGTLHGIYCDPASGEETRVNALNICEKFAEQFTPKIKSDLIDRHHDYRARNEEKRAKASQKFFETLHLVGLLGESEVHALISSACKNLMSVHRAFDNFYNEPPFAERLADLTVGQAVPETAQDEFVTTVVACAIGNAYGISRLAEPHYRKMVKSFSPREISIMLSLPDKDSTISNRIEKSASCRNRFKDLVKSLTPESIPTPARSLYKKWV